MEFSVVIPAKNEQDNVKPLIREIVSALEDEPEYEIVYVDDGSSDLTYTNLMSLVREARVSIKPVRLAKSVGQSTAILAGVQAARGELIITLDADGQNDPQDIPLLLNKARQLPLYADFCVIGFRKNRKDTRWKHFQSRIANSVRQKFLKDGTPDTGCGLKLIPRDTYLKLPYFDHMHRFTPALVRRMNGSVVVVEVNHRPRQSGLSKYNMVGRLGVGIIDLLGVMWLQRRTKTPEPLDDSP